MRLELSRRTDLALRVIRALDGVTRTGTELGDETGSTHHVIGQLMRTLTASGWVDSQPGPHGGYRLAEPTYQKSLLDLIEIIEGPITDDRCVLKGVPCSPPSPCALHEPWTRARAALAAELARIPVKTRP